MNRTFPTSSNTSKAPAPVPVRISRKYNMDVVIVTKPKQVLRVEGCFAFMFTNIGDTVGSINGIVVNPSTTPATSLGDSRTIGAHEGDEYFGFINVMFDSSGGGTAPKIEVIQLFYVD